MYFLPRVTFSLPSLVNVHQLHNFVWQHEAYVHPRYTQWSTV